jgi:hypothetical protein
LDRHAAYVALSRHRDRVDLHYGQDDFADQGRLVRTLSRDRPKDMASDYVRGFADRRAILMPDVAAREIERLAAERPLDRPQHSPLEQAVVRAAQSIQAILRAREQGAAEPPHQRVALDKADAELNRPRPGSSRDLRAALYADRSLIGEAAVGRPQAAIRAMAQEAEMRVDGPKRADRFVARWNQLQALSSQAHLSGDIATGKAARDSMVRMARSLERDPQLESILAARKSQLGIQIETGRRLGAELAFNHGLDLGRGRGLSR